MNTPSIDELISEVQRLILAHQYLDELEVDIPVQQRKVSHLRKELDRLQAAIDKADSKGLLERVFSDLRTQKAAKAEELREEYFDKAKELNETEELVKLLHFEQQVLREKVEREEEVRAQLQEAMRQRKSEIEASNSPHMQELLDIYEKIDECTVLQQEIAEIIHEGEVVLEIIQKIDWELKHNLVRKYETQKYETPDDGVVGGFSITSKKVVAQVKSQARQLKSSLQSFHRELGDVLEETNPWLVLEHDRSAYYKAISYAETISKNLLRHSVNQQHRHPLREIVKDIKEINALFLEEQLLLDEELAALNNKKDDLLASGS